MEPYKYTTPAEDLEVLFKHRELVKFGKDNWLEDDLKKDVLFYFGERGGSPYLIDSLFGNGDDFPDITEYLPCLSKEEFKGDKFALVVKVLHLLLDKYKYAKNVSSASIEWNDLIKDKRMAREMGKFEKDLCDKLKGKLKEYRTNFDAFGEFERSVLKGYLQ